MTRDQHEIRRKLRILEHADKIGDVSKTCRYFGIGRACLGSPSRDGAAKPESEQASPDLIYKHWVLGPAETLRAPCGALDGEIGLVVTTEERCA